MDKKFLYAIIVALLVVVVGGGVYFVLNGGSKPKAETGNMPSANTGQNNAASAGRQLSEQPNQAQFNLYFADASLAKLPSGVTFSPDALVKTSAFNLAVGEKFCTSLDVIKSIPKNSYAEAIYDTNTKSYAISRQATPRALATGNTMGCESLMVGPSKPLPVGNYEYKAYVDNVLVIVLPFEVR